MPYRFEYRNFNYDRNTLAPGAVHLGLGNFCRAFWADILDDVAEKGGKDLGLIAVAPTTRQMRDYNVLRSQDNIYHLLRQNGREICQRIGVLQEVIIGATHAAKVVDTLARDETQIVTMTLTGEGYFPLQPTKDGTLVNQANDLDALRAKDWGRLQTPFGWIAAGLYKRFEAHKKPFVVMSLDNLLFNGEVSRNALLRLAVEIGDKDFTRYLETELVTPNTAVDRITPQQNYDNQALRLKEKAGDSCKIWSDGELVHDRQPVISEEHRELVIEDHGRLPASLRSALQTAHVKFVGDVSPYQERKLRILNGAHMLFGISGKILVKNTTHEVLENSAVKSLRDHMLMQAADNLVPTQPRDEDPHAYTAHVVERLENPHLTDQIDRLITATHSKVTARFVDRSAIEAGFPSDAASAVTGTWLRFLQERDESGNPFSLEKKDIGVAEKFGFDDLDSPHLQNNLCRFLTQQNLSEVSPHWGIFTADAVDAARLIDKVGFEAAIGQIVPPPPTHPGALRRDASRRMAPA